MSAHLQRVHVRVNDAATGKPTPCRVRFTDAEGNYYPPLGRSAKFPADCNHAISGNVYIGTKQYAYIDGGCEIGLPPGLVHVAIAKGPEYEAFDQSIALPPGKLALRFELKRLIDPAREGWHAGAFAVTPLSPHDVLLEAAAEGLRVVDLLAFERETAEGVDFPNLLAFSGQRAALENSECLVAVNTLNGHLVLGGLALLNCHRPVFPIRFGRSRMGEPSPDHWSLADWCDQCHRKNGLVIGMDVGWREKWHGGEGLADVILGKVDAVALGELYLESIQWWYTLLSLGLRVPIVAGLPMRQLGLFGRTYVRLPLGQEFSYANWIEAIRAGRTVVADGPLLMLTVNDKDPGASIDLGGPAVVRVRAAAHSRDAFHELQIIHDGQVVTAKAADCSADYRAAIEMEVQVAKSGWLAARCVGESIANVVPLAAHTSPVYLSVDRQSPAANQADIRIVNELLDRTLAWVERDAQSDNPKDRQRLANVFVDAKQLLLQRLKH